MKDLKSKRGTDHCKEMDINPEEVPGNDPEEYNDGEPVEEKSPRAS